MATNGHFCWPSVGTFVAAYGQFSMAANTGQSLAKNAHHCGQLATIDHQWASYGI